jgi:hypothetical protein
VSALADGEYVLTQDVRSPLPTRLQTRRRGWMRAPLWTKGTHFTITNRQWECDRHFGYSRGGAARLTQKQKNLVFFTLRSHLEPWAPALPSHIMGGYEGARVLDFLVTTGRLTLDEVREAHALREVGDAIAEGLRALCPKPCPYTLDECFNSFCQTHADERARANAAAAAAHERARANAAAAAAQAPTQAPTTLRIGDVIGAMGDRYVVMDRCANGQYTWQSENPSVSRPSFEGPYNETDEHFIGHVADMIAAGLGALLDTPVPSTCPSHGTIPLGTVIRSNGGGFLWVATCLSTIAPDPPAYLWTNEDGTPVTDRFNPDQETIVGHVADMIAEGLRAVNDAPAIDPGAAYRDGLSRSEYARKKNPHMGDATGPGPDTSSSDDCWTI